MTVADHVLVAAIGIAWPLYGFLTYRAFRADVERGTPGARLAGYAEGMAIQWLFASIVIGLWIFMARDFAALSLTWPHGTPAWGAFGVATALSVFLVGQSAVVARRPETHARVREAVRPAEELLPVTRHDFTGFVAMSLTAGICEELFFRGFLPWYFGLIVGPFGGQAASVALFTLGHLYLGPALTLRAGLAGVVAAGLVLWSGSLLPAILLHAAMDIGSGWMGYIVLRAPDGNRSTTAA